jgi:hypothetical protein
MYWLWYLLGINLLKGHCYAKVYKCQLILTIKLVSFIMIFGSFAVWIFFFSYPIFCVFMGGYFNYLNPVTGIIRITSSSALVCISWSSTLNYNKQKCKVDMFFPILSVIEAKRLYKHIVDCWPLWYWLPCALVICRFHSQPHQVFYIKFLKDMLGYTGEEVLFWRQSLLQVLFFFFLFCLCLVFVLFFNFVGAS